VAGLAVASFDVHGLTLEARSNRPELLELLERRLGFFAAPATGSPAARLDLTVGDGVLVEPPSGPTRVVYEPQRGGDVLYDDEHDELFIEVEGARALCRAEAGEVMASLPETTERPAWAATRALVTLPLLELLKRRGRYGVHAAGVAQAGQAVLIAGESGAGKTTLSLALVRAGFEFLGDDMVFLRDGEDGPLVLAFPDELDVAETTAAFFPGLGEQLTDDLAGAPKRQLAAEQLGKPVATTAAPSLLLFPSVAGEEHSTTRPISADEATLELAPNVLLTERDSSQRHLDALGALAGASRCYRVAAGSDLDELVALVRGLLT
jgi:hypothetical protein